MNIIGLPGDNILKNAFFSFCVCKVLVTGRLFHGVLHLLYNIGVGVRKMLYNVTWGGGVY